MGAYDCDCINNLEYDRRERKERKRLAKSDTISRQQTIDVLNDGAELLRRALEEIDLVGAERVKYEWGLGLIESCIADVKELPSA